MPVYDYACADCGAFEEVRRIAERDDPALCPRCKAAATRVVIGAPTLGGDSSSMQDDSAGSYGMRHRGGCSCCG
jgi:putative FmdB family regulatory protein